MLTCGGTGALFDANAVITDKSSGSGYTSSFEYALPDMAKPILEVCNKRAKGGVLVLPRQYTRCAVRKQAMMIPNYSVCNVLRTLE